jgi:hypothetical protein
MRKINFKLCFFYSVLVCALFAGCATDESAAESGQNAGGSGAAGTHAHAPHSADEDDSDQDAGPSKKPVQPSAAGSGAAGAKATAPAAGGAKAMAPTSSTGSGGSSAATPAAGGSSGGAAASPAANSGSAATPAAGGSGGTGGAAPWDNIPVIPKNMPTANDEIDTVMMDVKYVLGASGNLDPEPRPIIMFKDGWACRDINFVVENLSVAEHKAMHPDSWVQWKVVDGKVALAKDNDWSKMYFQIKYPPNEVSLALDRAFTFSHVATLGNTSLFTKQSIRFTSDHSVVLGREPADTSHRGTYLIDGYAITLKWEDGNVTRTSFVWSDKDPAAIYIGGDAYLTRN